VNAVITASTVRDVLIDATARLESAGVESPRADAEWLLAIVLEVGRASLHVDVSRVVPTDAAARYAEAIERRAAREPMQRIVGWEEFRGLRMSLTPDVLVPRPETEMLVEWALALLPSPASRRLRVLDVGTGSGCIACALAHERSDADVVALDVSAAAASVARANAASLGLALRVRVVVGDLAGALAPAWADLIVANLPYLTRAEIAGLQAEVREHEPRLALDGGADGLSAVDALLPDALRSLRPGGALVLETGGEAHVRALGERLRAVGFVDVVPRADLAGVVRFIAARRPGVSR
jgi:release factor glutamine methyltransferase